MAVKGIKVELGQGGVDGTIFFGGTTALELLGKVSTDTPVPSSWKKMLDTFYKCCDGDSFSFAGQEIIRTGFYVKVKGQKFVATNHDDKGPAYWEIAKNVSAIDKVELAAKMRVLLNEPATKSDPWVATLTAAMFLSEVARNPRSFMINLMLLDMIEGKVKYGSEATKELDFKKLLVYSEKKKDFKYSRAGNIIVDKPGEDHGSGTLRGGKLPMSHLNAMKHYGETSKAEYEDFDQSKKGSGLNLKAPSEAGVDYHFSSPLLEKECTILLRWLLAYFEKNPLSYSAYVVRNVPKPWAKNGEVISGNKFETVPASLSAIRNHIREKEWRNATESSANSMNFKNEVVKVLGRRQVSASLLL